VCRIVTEQTNNKEKASRQTHARNNKINEEKHRRKTQMEKCSVRPCEKKAKKSAIQIPSGIFFLTLLLAIRIT
jgi:hypothetical protein